jgi:hypothetical protein
MNGTEPSAPLARNVTRLSHLGLPGAGQVNIANGHAFIGHVPNPQSLGTTIVDVSDPRKPRIVAQLTLDDPDSHSHKVRAVGDIMIVNHERNQTPVGRKAELLPPLRARLRESLGREPSHAELAQHLGIVESDIPMIEAAEKTPYGRGGFRVYDIADRGRPRLLVHQKTGGIGVHRFHMDEQYAYISTEMAGYVGNILVIYDLRNPSKPEEVSRWWMPGQHLAGGETPTWVGRRNRLHHALRFGDELWAACWQAGLRVIDVQDIRRPRTLAEHNYHPPFPEPSHTFMPVPFPINGRRLALAIDEEDMVRSAEEMERRRGRPHGGLWVFDVTELPKIRPLAIYEASELDSPYSRVVPGRFGGHQFQEHMQDTLVCCAWFSGGLRIVDIADPLSPREVGSFIPEPAPGKAGPLTNDVDVDDRGLIYIVDRWAGFDVLEFTRTQ